MIVLVQKTLTAKILFYLHENPGASIKDLSAIFNANLQTIRNTIYRLKNNGFVEKTGDGYILTNKGEWFVNHVLRRETSISTESMEKRETVAEEKKTITETSSGEKPYAHESINIEASLTNIDSLRNRVVSIERELEIIKNTLNRLVREINDLKKTIEEKSKALAKPEEKTILPNPVMNIHEAMSLLGLQLDRYRLEGRVEVIGSLIVERSFYESFKKKFPIDISEADKLSEVEKILLNEMIRDARVIIHAGKQYKLLTQ